MNRLLLDTHALLWWLDGGERLAEQAYGLIADETTDVVVSVATLWEVAIKISVGKMRVDGDLRQRAADQGFTELPVLGPHTLEIADLPFHHRDPFDRMLVAQARYEDCVLVTADNQLSAYDVPILAAS